MRRFLECLIPTTACNLKCSYCYLIQENRRTNERATFNFSPEIIGQALSKDRLGGVSLISMTASGETLLPKEIPSIAKEILHQGHFVNITTNGTLTQQIEKLLKETSGYHAYLHISFSLHYLELLSKGLLDVFFENVKKVWQSGCSILVQINLVDEYIPYWDTIKQLCIDNLGAMPQVALTRDESNNTYRVLTKLSMEEYKTVGNEMDSPLFRYTCDNFMVKRKEFCYAGLWSAKLNLGTGVMSACYGQGLTQNIFEDISKPIKFEPIGHNCPFQYCFNSSHFLSQGIIPELSSYANSYASLRNRNDCGWYTKEALAFLGGSFLDENPKLSLVKRYFFDIKYRLREYIKRFKNNLRWKTLLSGSNNV